MNGGQPVDHPRPRRVIAPEFPAPGPRARTGVLRRRRPGTPRRGPRTPGAAATAPPPARRVQDLVVAGRPMAQVVDLPAVERGGRRAGADSRRPVRLGLPPPARPFVMLDRRHHQPVLRRPGHFDGSAAIRAGASRRLRTAAARATGDRRAAAAATTRASIQPPPHQARRPARARSPAVGTYPKCCGPSPSPAALLETAWGQAGCRCRSERARSRSAPNRTRTELRS